MQNSTFQCLTKSTASFMLIVTKYSHIHTKLTNSKFHLTTVSTRNNIKNTKKKQTQSLQNSTANVYYILPRIPATAQLTKRHKIFALLMKSLVVSIQSSVLTERRNNKALTIINFLNLSQICPMKISWTLQKVKLCPIIQKSYNAMSIKMTAFLKKQLRNMGK
eukprot:TRINITY_DN4794_c0_g1_i7.p2 TRINITY_DN4794_c0_g1~~TRINITY_DN4794_c0_g1_i7.p2  ORF type:complete len:163 (+),score=1.86 TRINITY_DN4794_c0_g1_i7:130-618(+)